MSSSISKSKRRRHKKRENIIRDYIEHLGGECQFFKREGGEGENAFYVLFKKKEMDFTGQFSYGFEKDGTTTWKRLDYFKRRIERHFERPADGLEECFICMEKSRKISCCSECFSTWCHGCFVKLFKSGEGIITCPGCRFKYGRKHSPTELTLGIVQICSNSNLNPNDYI